MLPEIHLYNRDCVAGMAEKIPDNSIHLTVTSIPFEEIFSYSGKLEDVGNNGSTINIREGRFALNLRFVIEQLLRVTAPGCNVAIHVQQLLAYKNQHGFIGRRDFRGAVIDLFSAGGFNFIGEFAIVKNPQALKNGTKVLTPRGWTEIEGLVKGDFVVGSRGRAVRVTGVQRHEARQLYKVTFNDGAEIACDGHHLWGVYKAGASLKNEDLEVLTTEQMMSEGLTLPSGGYRYYVPLVKSIEFNESGLPLDPYLVGALIGDGNLLHRRVTLTKDDEVVKECRLPEGHYFEKIANTGRASGTVNSWALKSPDGRNNRVISSLKSMGLFNLQSHEKFIPDSYKIAPESDRWRLLQGLLDTDGTVKRNPRNGSLQIKFSTTSDRLAQDFRFLVQSLGGLVSGKKIKGSKYRLNGEERFGRDIWALIVQIDGEVCPFLLKRKAEKWQPRKYRVRRAVTSIVPAETAECTCITVDSPDKLYVTEGCVLTHNSMAQRLNLHSLMFVTGKRNSTMLAPAPNDYVLIFSKPGETAHPVRALYDKQINPDGWITTEEWIRDAHGIWTDINEIDVLDGYRAARESDQEKHVCPLQLEVIRRLVKLYTNPISKQPDVTVLDPFSGIGSTAYIAVELNRNCVGFELKESYHEQAVKNVELARRLKWQEQADLFQAACS